MATTHFSMGTLKEERDHIRKRLYEEHGARIEQMLEIEKEKQLHRKRQWQQLHGISDVDLPSHSPCVLQNLRVQEIISGEPELQKMLKKTQQDVIEKLILNLKEEIEHQSGCLTDKNDQSKNKNHPALSDDANSRLKFLLTLQSKNKLS